MTERIRFFFDPVCPWCYQTSRWIRHVARLGEVDGAIGRRVHEQDERLDDADTIKRGLDDAGLDAGLADRAAAPDYADRVAAEHRGLAERTRSLGVPTLVLDDGQGPAIFGPVITEPPATDAQAVEFFRHVVWLTRHAPFAELKRERDGLPGLDSVRRSRP